MLPKEDFIQLLRTSPLISIDLVLRSPGGRVLVGLRNNAPARGSWFVPGGRVFKDEPLEEALGRISAEELGCRLGSAALTPLGVYQHLYPDNVFDLAGFGTHYVVLALTGELDPARLDPGACDQHRQVRWLSEAELLADGAVHPLTKAYFSEAPDNKFM